MSLEVLFAPQRIGQGRWVVAIQVLLWRVEGRVWVEHVDAHQPRRGALLAHKLNGFVRTPSGLVQRGRHPGWVLA